MLDAVFGVLRPDAALDFRGAKGTIGWKLNGGTLSAFCLELTRSATPWQYKAVSGNRTPRSHRLNLSGEILGHRFLGVVSKNLLSAPFVS